MLRKLGGPDGSLTCTGFTPSPGRHPRCIATSPGGTHMLVANEGAAQLAVFSVERETGELREAGQVALDLNPICVKFLAT